MGVTVFDIEVFPNLFRVGVMDVKTGITLILSSRDEVRRWYKGLRAPLVGFNSCRYDLPVLSAIINDADVYKVSCKCIEQDDPLWRWSWSDQLGLPKLTPTHVDLWEVSPSPSGLKVQAGRLGANISEFMLAWDKPLTDEGDIEKMERYLENDLEITRVLYESLKDDIKLRAALGAEFLSEPGARLGEKQIKSRLSQPPVPRPEKKVRYTAPAQFSFSDEMSERLAMIEEHEFEIVKGKVQLPDFMGNVIAGKYKMGVGGLHSTEKNRILEGHLIDIDVASYYPSILKEYGFRGELLKVYSSMIDERLDAKRTGDKLKADTLKLALNSMFGKLGNKYSKFYDPETLLRVTLSGQLFLLQLIEDYETQGFSVVSANTDGITVDVEGQNLDEFRRIYGDWEVFSGMTMEETEYRMMVNRSVNSYFAVQTDGGIKRKGEFVTAPSVNKSPDFPVIWDAIVKYFVNGVDVKEYIVNTVDASHFCKLRKVSGGATWRGENVGSVVRFYKAVDGDSLHYVTNGNKVPKSDNAVLAQNISGFDWGRVDYAWYIDATKEIIGDFK